MLCVGLALYGFLDFAFYWSFFYFSFSFIFMMIGFYGGMISGVLLLIFWLRDRSRPKQRGPVQQYSPLTPHSLVELQRILKISSKISIMDAANALQTNRAQLLKFISENQHNLPPLQFDGEFILVKIGKKPWVCQVCGFENEGDQAHCAECKSLYSR